MRPPRPPRRPRVARSARYNPVLPSDVSGGESSGPKGSEDSDAPLLFSEQGRSGTGDKKKTQDDADDDVYSFSESGVDREVGERDSSARYRIFSTDPTERDATFSNEPLSFEDQTSVYRYDGGEFKLARVENFNFLPESVAQSKQGTKAILSCSAIFVLMHPIAIAAAVKFYESLLLPYAGLPDSDIRKDAKNELTNFQKENIRSVYQFPFGSFGLLSAAYINPDVQHEMAHPTESISSLAKFQYKKVSSTGEEEYYDTSIIKTRNGLLGSNLAKLIESNSQNESLIRHLNNFMGFARNVVRSYQLDPENPVIEIGQLGVKLAGATRPVFVVGAGSVSDPAQRNLFNIDQIGRLKQIINEKIQLAYIASVCQNGNESKKRELVQNGLRLRPGFFVPIDYYSSLIESDIKDGPFHNTFRLMTSLSSALTYSNNLFKEDPCGALMNFQEVADRAAFPGIANSSASAPSRTKPGLDVSPPEHLFLHGEEGSSHIQVRCAISKGSQAEPSPAVVLGSFNESVHYGILLKKYLRDMTSSRELQRGQLIGFISDGIKDLSLLNAIRRSDLYKGNAQFSDYEDAAGAEIRAAQPSKAEQSARLLARGFRERGKVGEREQYTEAEFLKLGREFASYTLIRDIISKLGLPEDKADACLGYADRGDACLTEAFYNEAKGESVTKNSKRQGSGVFRFEQVLRENQVYPPKVGKNLTKQTDILAKNVESVRFEIICQPLTEEQTYEATYESLPVRHAFPVEELDALLHESSSSALTREEKESLAKKNLILPSVVKKMAKAQLPLMTTIQRLVYAKLPLKVNKSGASERGLYLGSTRNYPERCVFVSMVAVINISTASYLEREPAVRKAMVVSGAGRTGNNAIRLVVIDDATIHEHSTKGSVEVFPVFRAKDLTADQIDTVLRNIHCVSPSWVNGKVIFNNFTEDQAKEKFIFAQANVWECTFGEVPYAIRAKQADTQYVSMMLSGAKSAKKFLTSSAASDASQQENYWCDAICSFLPAVLSETVKKQLPTEQDMKILVAAALDALNECLAQAANKSPRFYPIFYPIYASIQDSVMNKIKEIVSNLSTLTQLSSAEETASTHQSREDLWISLVYFCALGMLNTNPGYLDSASLTGAVQSDGTVSQNQNVIAMGRQRLASAYLSRYSIRDWSRYVLPYCFDVHVEPPKSRGRDKALTPEDYTDISRELSSRGVEYLSSRMSYAKQPLGLQEMRFAQSLVGRPLTFTAPSAYTPPPSEMGRGTLGGAGDTSSAKVIRLPMSRPSFSLDWLGLVFEMVGKIESLRKYNHDLSSFTRTFKVGAVKVGSTEITTLDVAALQYGLPSPFEPGIKEAEFKARLAKLRDAIAESPIMPVEDFTPAAPKGSQIAKLNPGNAYRPALKEYLRRKGRPPLEDNINYEDIANQFEESGDADEHTRFNYQELRRAFPRRMSSDEELSPARVGDALTDARVVSRLRRPVPNFVPSKVSLQDMGASLRTSKFENQEGLSAEEANQILGTISSRKQSRSKTTIPASSALCAKNRMVKLRSYEVPDSVRRKVGSENCLLWLAPPDTDNRIMSLRRDVHIDCDFVPQIGQELQQSKLLGMAFVNFLMWVAERPAKRAKTKLFVGRVGDNVIKLAWTAEYPLSIRGIMQCLAANQQISDVYGKASNAKKGDGVPKAAQDDIKRYLTALDSVKSAVVLKTRLDDDLSAAAGPRTEQTEQTEQTGQAEQPEDDVFARSGL